jgi:ABC-type branched-subunit amino acid transport system substrate-binding protein
LVISIAAVAALVGCGSSSHSSTSAAKSSTAAKATFNVLYITGLSGPLQVYGEDGLKGLQAAANVLNASGGILGHHIVVTSKDDDSTPANAVTELQAALSGSTKPDAVIDGLTGDEGLAMAAPLTAAHIISMNVSALPSLDNPTKYPYQFAGLPGYASEGHAVVQGLSEHGIKSVAVLYPLDANGTEELQIFQPEFKAAGITVTGSVGYPDAALNVTPEWLKAAATHPQGYVLITAGQAPVALNSRAKAGITAYTQCDTTCAANPLAKLVSHAGLVNAWTFNPPLLVTPPSQRTAAQKTFVAAITKLGFPPDLGVPSLEYDFLMALNEAATQAKSVTEATLYNAFLNIHNPQAFASGMPIQYSATDHYPVPNSDTSVWKLFPTTDSFVDDVYLPAK